MTTSTTEPGRRERKKAATRAAISAAALRLFLARGYPAVSVKDIAEEADVAVTTVFKHFTGKEALVFDEESEIERALVAAVTDRDRDQPVLDALENWALGTRAVRQAGPGTEFARFRRLIEQTPELSAYRRQMWMRHAGALAGALREASGDQPWALSPLTALAVAHFVLDACDLARRSDAPAGAVAEAFALLRAGWPH